MRRLLTALVMALFVLGGLASPLYAQAPKEPAKTETKQPAKPAAPKKAPLDLNTASEDELKALPGIGEAYSKRIIENRPYARKDELVKKKVNPLPSPRCRCARGHPILGRGRSVSHWHMIRPIRSVEPPALNGTTSRTGRAG
jgi:hypothetical protein